LWKNFSKGWFVVKRNSVILVVIVAVVAAMIYAGARLSRKSAQAAGGVSGGAEESVLKAGGMAPDFELKTLDGKLVKLSSLRGKAVLLNFWATWCGPCKIETPWIVDLSKRYQAQGLEVVGISMDDSGSTDDIAKFVKEMDINYTIVQGTEAVGDAYGGVGVLPVSYYIDRNGKIVNTVIGIGSGQSEMEDHIKTALAVPVQTASVSGVNGK
jgi:peroxiredoxin